MKKIFFLLLTALMVNGQWSMVNGQTVAIHTDALTLLATPDEVGEMMFSGGMLSIGDTVIDVTTIDSLSYSAGDFDPLTVSVSYAGSRSRVSMPLALADSVQVEQDGAYVNIISAKTGGTEVVYSLSGTTADGCFRQEGSYKCTVQLNGVSITSQRGAALHVKNGKRIDIEAVEGTVNNFVDHADTLHDACFHVKGHPEFFGSGTINITGRGKHAFKSGEYTKLKKTAGTINILAAPNDGMHVNQYFKMNGGKLTIADGVKGDGVQAECNSDSTKEYNGYMFINGGDISITIKGDSCEGLKCDSLLCIGGGTQQVNCSGKFSKCISAGTDMAIYNLLSSPQVTLVNTGTYVTVGDKTKKSVCLKVEGSLYFHTGTVSLTADEDLKGKSAAIAGDYVYVRNAGTIKASPAMDVDGALRSRRSEADIIAFEATKGLVLPTASPDDEE